MGHMVLEEKMKLPSVPPPPHLKEAVTLNLIIHVLINPSSTYVWHQVWLKLVLVFQDDENVKSKNTTDADNLIRNAH